MATAPRLDAPNFTMCPNDIADYWMPLLSPGSFKVLYCFCRKIYGWHKTSDSISINQLMRATGIGSKTTIIKALTELEGHGLVKTYKHQNEYGHQPNTYSLNVSKPIDKLYTDQNLGGGCIETIQGPLVQKLDTQKKDLSYKRKEREDSVESSNTHTKISNQEKQKSKEFFGKNKKVLLTEKEHQDLVDEHGKERVDMNIRDLDSKIMRGKYLDEISHFHTLQDFISIDERPLKSKVSDKKEIEKNKDWALKVEKYLEDKGRAGFSAYEDHVIISIGSSQKIIEYNKENFKTIVEEYLKLKS